MKFAYLLKNKTKKFNKFREIDKIMKEEINLKPTDKKLLAQLYHNSRESSSKIAKHLNISREQVVYRIKKFESQNIIKGYIPLINYSRLGYHIINLVLFKFNKQNYVKEFKNRIKKSKNRITTVEILTKYDLGALFIFKSEKEKNDTFSELLSEHSMEISEYLIIEPYFSELYPLKFINNKTSPHIFQEYQTKEYKLDEKEKKILSILNKNANSRIIDIAGETNLSAELIVYKLKKLKEEKVLISTRAYFNMNKIGYFYSILLINLRNFSKTNQEKIRNFAKNSDSVDSLMFMTGNPNCYMQIFHKEVSEIHKILQKLKETFPNESLTIEILPLMNEGEDVNPIPFL